MSAPSRIFVFDELELSLGLRLVFNAREATMIARQWMERFPADERAARIGLYYESPDFWRNELLLDPSGEGADPSPRLQGIADFFRVKTEKDRMDFVLSDSGNFVLLLVSLTSPAAWERVRQARGIPVYQAYQRTAWMHSWLADLYRERAS